MFSSKDNTKTQIIATIGPASESEEILDKMVKHNMDIARLNFSHNDHAWHKAAIENIRLVAAKNKRRIPIIQDLSGPRVKEGNEHKFDKRARSIITKKDLEDLKFGLKKGVEYVALSYVGRASDIEKLRKIINEAGSDAKIIAKIERKKALGYLDEIIAAADAIMIARGDLGNDVPLEEIPFIQFRIIRKCNGEGKPVIVATEMLPSMEDEPEPTRSDVSDVANAVLSGADAVMLSQESAIGKYPVEAVAMMERIADEAEDHISREYNHL